MLSLLNIISKSCHTVHAFEYAYLINTELGGLME